MKSDFYMYVTTGKEKDILNIHVELREFLFKLLSNLACEY